MGLRPKALFLWEHERVRQILRQSTYSIMKIPVRKGTLACWWCQRELYRGSRLNPQRQIYLDCICCGQMQRWLMFKKRSVDHQNYCNHDNLDSLFFLEYVPLNQSLGWLDGPMSFCMPFSIYCSVQLHFSTPHPL